MTYGIFGGGFGLYGYLPALAQITSSDILTRAKYRQIVEERADLAPYRHRIIYCANDDEILLRSNRLLVALRPADQVHLLTKLVAGKWRGRLVMEKPVAPDPQQAVALIRQLRDAGIRFEIGFTLAATDWFREFSSYLARSLTSPAAVHITWHFNAHHYRNNLPVWKRWSSEGGGALRFYGIHLIAAFASFDDVAAVACERELSDLGEEPRCWFRLAGRTFDAAVECDTAWPGEPGFSVRASRRSGPAFSRQLADPLCEGHRSGLTCEADTRVRYLIRILRQLETSTENSRNWYERHALLWCNLEAVAEKVRPHTTIE